MTRPNRRAFTLVELLIVIAVIALLIAMLVPGAAKVWQVFRMTQCMTNLATIYKAEQMWRQERDSMLFTRGYDWAYQLGPYVTSQGVFSCPEGPTALKSDAGENPNDPGPVNPPDQQGIGAFSFDVYSGPDFKTKLWNVDINAGQWVRKTKVGRNKWHYGIEDLGWQGSGDDWCDIDFTVEFRDGVPYKVWLIQGKHASQGYRFDMIVRGKVVIHNVDDYVQQEGWPTDGRTVDLGKYFAFLASDYGLSRGSYDAFTTEATAVDGRLFLALDYGELIADYTGIDEEDQTADWPMYFFTDLTAWQQTYNQDESLNWRRSCALRHSSQANVLFCDGHVEALTQDDLKPNNRLWRYTDARTAKQ